MNKIDIIASFKNKELHKTLDIVLDDVENFEFEKGVMGTSRDIFTINCWRINPMADEGSFLYYDDIEGRDADWDLLMSLIEASQY